MSATTAARSADRMPHHHASTAQPWLVPTLTRIKAEYAEMPGLCLTERQAQRLLGLDAESCEHVFDALVAIGYLRSTPRGYVRA